MVKSNKSKKLDVYLVQKIMLCVTQSIINPDTFIPVVFVCVGL